MGVYIGERYNATRYMEMTVPDGMPELGRFAEPSLYILVSLSDGPRHGYAIMTDVEATSGVPLGPGTLYGALSRLEQRGLIEALEPEDRRRPYRLTPLGASTLAAQLEGLADFATTSLRRLGRPAVSRRIG
jgi:DNA-binding PadR family transcriptional regulator